ncbi:ferrichrome ABC transporter substrate-binding protein [Tardiphaga sp.]|uniref:ferrichrome ABC transporter substrate-binding protein n=1 Tax=Tardiphaga sp. TaxID=1926292 RepID=UPI0025CE6E83|nr:ferrichrome ABC transporter substrate-binding protein [Tardiphaga sp.]
MNQPHPSATIRTFASRMRRLPFVLALTLGLLLSLIHCAGDGFAFAAPASNAVITSGDSGAPSDLPDQLLPAHSGHCLSHVTAPPSSSAGSPIDRLWRAPGIAVDQSPAMLAGLLPFKPPRA